jgi:hypothetical protein
MKKIVLSLMVIIFLSSCMRYKVESSSPSGCGVWYPAGKFNK